MSSERRDEMIIAAESSEGFTLLRDLVRRLLAEGLSPESLLEDLAQVRPLVAEEVEDRVLDVMDLLVGWCAPEHRLVPPEENPL